MLGQLVNPVHRLIDSLRRDTARTLLMAAALGLVGWLVLYPLVILLLLGLHDKDGAWTLDNYRAVFTEPRLVGALANSVIVSAATLVVSLVLALPLAWGVARTRMPRKWMVNVAVTIAFVIPNFIGAIAWILLLGKNAGLLNVLARQVFGGFLFDVYSIPGLVLVLALSFFPIIYFSAQAALENIDPMYEEAAQMSGAPAWRASLGISLPLVLPAIVSSSVLVFLEAMAAFGAPAAIATGGNFHLLTTELYDMFSYPPRFELAAASASPIIGFTLLGLWLQRLALGRRRYTVIGGKAAQSRPVEIGWGRWVIFAYAVLVILATVVLPSLVLLRASLLTKWVRPFISRNITLDNYRLLFDTGSIVPTSIKNSMLTAVGTATLACVLAVVVVLDRRAHHAAGAGTDCLRLHRHLRLSRHRLGRGLRAWLQQRLPAALRHALAVSDRLHRPALPLRLPRAAQCAEAARQRAGGCRADVGCLVGPDHYRHLGAAAAQRAHRRLDHGLRGDHPRIEHGDPALCPRHRDPAGGDLLLCRQRHLRARRVAFGRAGTDQYRLRPAAAPCHRPLRNVHVRNTP